MNLYTELLHLTTIPSEKIAQLALVRLCACCNERTAKLARFLVYNGIMPAKFEHSCGFHAAYTSAYYMHRL